MNYDELMLKYKNKYDILKGGSVDQDNILKDLIQKWWRAAQEKDNDFLRSMILDSSQVVTINSRFIGKEEIINGIDNYTLKGGYRLYDFKFTNDVNNVIVSYLVDNEIESTTGSKVNNAAIHTVVFNRDNKIISWNNFSH